MLGRGSIRAERAFVKSRPLEDRDAEREAPVDAGKSASRSGKTAANAAPGTSPSSSTRTCPSCATPSTPGTSRSAGSTRRSSSATCRSSTRSTGMAHDGVPFALTMSVTPPLAAMMKDELLRQRFHEHLGAARGARRARREAPLGGRALRAGRHLLPGAPRPDARGLGPPRGRRRRGAGAATGTRGGSSFSRARRPTATCPGCSPAREGIRPQLELGRARLRAARRAHARPGAWLAECAYHPSFDEEIARAGIRFTVARHARHHERAPASALRRPRAHRAARAASRSSGATPSRASRCGRATRATRATPSTATSTATSASTCPRRSSWARSPATARA